MDFHVPGDFSIGDTEKEKAKQWLKEHAEKCLEIHPPARHLDVSGGLVSYVFTPTSIGVGVSVKCACGEEFDVTDYSSW